MRGRVLAAAFAVVCLALAAHGRAPHDASPAGEISDVPPGPATIRGRVVAPGGDTGAADVEVVLYALSQGRPPGLRRTQTDSQGRFAFERIANDSETSYLLGARRDEVPFPGERVSFASGELEREVEIRMADLTADPGVVQVGPVEIRLDSIGGRLVVSEKHRLRNPSGLVYYVSDGDRAKGAPAFRTELPAAASNLAGPLGMLPDGVVRDADTLRFFGPIYPGEQDLSFSYTLPQAEAGASVSRRLVSGAESLTLLAPETGLEVRAQSLAAGETLDREGRRYRSFGSGRLAPGARVAFDVTLAEAERDPAALSVGEVRVFLEQDAAALTVREEHRFSVAGERMLVGEPGSLYRISLPPQARDIRFATDPPGISLAPSEQGGIDVLGPIPAGDSVVELLYHVPVHAGRTTAVLQASRAIPLLSVFVADTGVELVSDRLHRRRPVRSQDRTYLHLEAFDVEPNERIEVAVSSLSRPDAPTTTTTLVLAAVLAGALVWFLAAPLRRSVSAAATSSEESQAEREALHAAIRDLEEDFETGKLSEGDFSALRDEQKRRAATLLRSERKTLDAASAASRAPTSASHCDGCGRRLGSEDRFCSSCGAAVPGRRTLSREASA